VASPRYTRGVEPAIAACPDEDELLAAITAGLGSGDAAALRIEAHLDGCARCSAAIASFAQLDAGDEAAPFLARGETVGRHVVLELRGAGASAAVYAAYDPLLDRKVALKWIHEQALAGSTGEARLEREARLLARVSHPNIVAVHDVLRHEGGLVLVLALIEGETLSAWLARRSTSEARRAPSGAAGRRAQRGSAGQHPRGAGARQEIVRAFRDAGAGLAAAHAAGVVHRDVKPENLLVGADGRVRVADFGLSAVEGQGAGGRIAGTPAYLAPEVEAGADADPRADQFAFCVSLVEALAGKRPFPDVPGPERRAAIERGLEAHGLPRRIARVARRGLASDPARRYASMDALLADLAPRRRRWTLATAAVSAAVTAGVIVAMRTPAPAAQPAPCAIAAQQAAALWPPGKRLEIANAFAATHLPYAARSADRVTALLDERVAAWTRARTGVCLAGEPQPWIGPLIDAPDASCVDRQRRDLAGVIGVLDRADAKTVERGVLLVQGIASLDECRARHGDASAFDPAPARRERALDELVAARLSFETGKSADAAAGVTRALDELGDTPSRSAASLRAEALYYRAVAEIEGAPAQAEADLRRGIREASIAGDDFRIASLWAKLLELRGTRLGRTEEALRWWEVVQAATIRAGSPPSLVAHLDLIESRILGAAGRGAEARQRRAAAVTLLESAYGPRHLETLHAKQLLAVADALAGEREAARASLVAIAATLRDELGDTHPEYAATLFSLGSVELAADRLDDAQRDLEAALHAAEVVHGPDSAQAADALDNLGEVARGKHDTARAVELQRRVLAIREHLLAADHPDVAIALNNLAMALEDAGQRVEARTLVRRAVAIAVHLYPPSNPDRQQYEENLRRLGG
jgi:tRNA A-37 threonylcarbamoyl transferase component Bud32